MQQEFDSLLDPLTSKDGISILNISSNEICASDAKHNVLRIIKNRKPTEVQTASPIIDVRKFKRAKDGVQYVCLRQNGKLSAIRSQQGRDDKFEDLEYFQIGALVTSVRPCKRVEG